MTECKRARVFVVKVPAYSVDFDDEVIKAFESERISRIEKIKNENEKKKLYITGLLLRRVFEMHQKSAKDIVYLEGKKPVLKDSQDFFFNISHSGDYIVMGTSDIPIGIDIQKKVEPSKALAERVLTKEEIRRLSDDFNLYWAIKEAYLKLTGTGISLDLKEIEVLRADDESLTWMVHDNTQEVISKDCCPNGYGKLFFDNYGYKGVICAEEPVDFEVTFIDDYKELI